MKLFPTTTRESIVDADAFLKALAENRGGIRWEIVATLRFDRLWSGSTLKLWAMYKFLRKKAKEAYPDGFAHVDGDDRC